MWKHILGDLDALLVSNPYNVCYLTQFMGTDPYGREAFVLITKDELFLCTSFIYLEQAQPLVNQRECLTILEISHGIPLTQRIHELTEKHKLRRIGYESTHLTVFEYEELKEKLPNISLIPITGRIEKLRQIKNQQEIGLIKKAAALTDQTLREVVTILKPGVSEQFISWQIESFIRSQGGEISFSPIVAFGRHSSMPHYDTKNNAKLKQKDVVLLDFGAKVDGYCSDITRIVFLRKPDQEIAKSYATVLHAQEAAINLLKQGERSGAVLDLHTRKIIEQSQLPPYLHSLGHNLGLEIHEAPRLSMHHDVELKPGMVFTIEPGVYLKGKYGIRIEDLVLLKKDGIETLSKTPKKMLVID